VQKSLSKRAEKFVSLRTTVLEPHLISSVAGHMFVKIKQKLYVNMPKEALQQPECVDTNN